MQHTYKVTGMTCNGCRTSIEDKLNATDGVLYQFEYKMSHVDSFFLNLNALFINSVTMLYNLITAFLDFKITSALMRHFIRKLVLNAAVDLEKAEAIIEMSNHISISILQKALSDKYSISEKNEFALSAVEGFQATFIENSIMIVMAIIMLIKTYN